MMICYPFNIMIANSKQLGNKNKMYVNQVGDKLVLSKEPPKDRSKGLKRWFEEFVKENGEILDELATVLTSREQSKKTNLRGPTP